MTSYEISSPTGITIIVGSHILLNQHNGNRMENKTEKLPKLFKTTTISPFFTSQNLERGKQNVKLFQPL